jgi:transposase-like protein
MGSLGSEVDRSNPARPEAEDAGDGEPALSVGAVARRLGVAPATLRTWDRRYGVGPSGHTTGRHRRYRPLDIARLELMQRALLRGASPAEAARYAVGAGVLPDAGTPTAARAAELGPVSPIGSDGARAGETALGPALTAEGGFVPGPGRAPRFGGRALPLPGAGRQARGLGRAVLAMDSDAAAGLLAESIAAAGLAAAWDQVIRPVLGATVQRFEHSGVGAEFELLLHECVLTALLRATPVVDQPRNPRPVLLACAPGERSSLPLRALVAELAARSLATRMFGSGLPAEALAAAIRRTAPAVVVLWAASPRYADPDLADRVPRTRQRARLLLAGPGWRHRVEHRADRRSGRQYGQVDPLDSLGAAADEIEQAALGRSA